MSRGVEWSASGLDDLDATIGFIARDNPHAARRVAAAIDSAVRKLAEMPTGRPGRVGVTYERKIPRLLYTIAYAIPETSRLVILRVIHNARDWPEESWPAE
ncbi:type II toxin-antitoxin system RelE/ParE family toxin [Bosea sp. 685]|uniref:type II toxin-antitoxin system RelE/ParE family toxin n=1 Tax=Bosea sp. 685 TaxID=3080057 RepID=UPI002892BCF7|nr:type II toxin-antitoxin system RelE/ParE family toxin [Bosea sp. 685]WNJ88163.1 type II toxin-antitoxin system RelE/ParE family toxin [Bosea sp. 685]